MLAKRHISLAPKTDCENFVKECNTAQGAHNTVLSRMKQAGVMINTTVLDETNGIPEKMARQLYNKTIHALAGSITKEDEEE